MQAKAGQAVKTSWTVLLARTYIDGATSAELRAVRLRYMILDRASIPFENTPTFSNVCRCECRQTS